MAFASLDDVKRILRITDTDDERDAGIQGALDAIDAWALRRLPDFTLEGAQMEVYFDMPEDATLRLPADDIVVTEVRVFEYPSSGGVPLSPIELGLGHGYDIDNRGNLMLRPTLFVSPFEGAGAWRKLRVYHRVEIHYTATGIVPRDVTEGVAFLAAGYWKDGPRALQGLTSERIGDYSYTLGNTGGAAGEPEYVGQARFFLGPYLRLGGRVTVI